jgi:hypothetical protein
MKPACIDALTRIFSLSDRDRNGFIDDQELNDFQRKCFGQPLQHLEIEQIKNTGSFLFLMFSKPRRSLIRICRRAILTWIPLLKHNVYPKGSLGNNVANPSILWIRR